MELTRFIRIAALTAATVTASASLTLAQGVPAEIPPASYAGSQYVDSSGCAFVRVGVGSNVEWVPRVGRDRRQICGQTPTGGAGTQTAAAPAPRQTVTTASRPAATATRPAAPMVRSVGSTPRATASQPRPVATTPRPMPTPPAASGVCANLPADIRPYFTGPNPRCGPQAVHPGDAARRLDQSSLGQAGTGAVRQVVRYEVTPPAGYRAAWDDDRMNPYRGLAFAGGQRQMEQVWANTVPRRLVGDEPSGFRAVFASPSQPATIVPARLVLISP
jgi:hypothetical protein